MEIFYINLDKDVERRESMERQLAELGLSYQRIPGVYARGLDEEGLNRVYSRKRALRRHSMDLVLAHVGCSMSKILAYREIVERDLPYALILEDDVIIPQDFNRCLEEVEQLVSASKAEILLLSPADGDFSNHKLIREKGAHQAAPYVYGHLASSYVVTKFAAQSLLQELFPIDDVADCWPRLNRYRVVDIWVLKQSLIEQDQETFGSSTNADFKPFPNVVAKAKYKLRRLRGIVLDRITAPWRRQFHPYNDVLKQK